MAVKGNETSGVNPQFRDYLLEMLAPLGPVGSKRFFSGSGLLYDTTIFGFIMGDTVYFRVDDSTRPRFEAAGAKPFDYNTSKRKVVVQAYYELPAELLDDPEALIDWARDAVAVAQKVEAAKRAKGKTAKSRGKARPSA